MPTESSLLLDLAVELATEAANRPSVDLDAAADYAAALARDAADCAALVHLPDLARTDLRIAGRRFHALATALAADCAGALLHRVSDRLADHLAHRLA